MSLALWPPNPIPPVDILILIVSAVGSVLAIRKFVRDLRHPPSSAVPSLTTAPQSNGPTLPPPTSSV